MVQQQFKNQETVTKYLRDESSNNSDNASNKEEINNLKGKLSREKNEHNILKITNSRLKTKLNYWFHFEKYGAEVRNIDRFGVAGAVLQSPLLLTD